MNSSRKEFLKATGLLIGGSVLSGHLFADTFSPAAKMKKLGIQLYTLRDDLPKDPKGILKKIASFGYQQVEGFEGEKGMFWGMTPKQFKVYLDSLGMKMVSSHCDIDKDFEKKAAEAASIGMKYLLSAWVGPQKTLDDYKKIADKFNERGRICKKHGIRFAYHNHDYSFVPLDGQVPQDVMMKDTDPSLVDFEMDIYWVVTAGEDPIAWLKKYPNRFRLCHIKDRKKDATPDQKDESVDLGEGSIDYPSIVKAAANYGMEYYILEQEKYEGTTPLKSAAKDALYMKRLVKG
jgi:sugar phosphate isomerase/epimerase